MAKIWLVKIHLTNGEIYDHPREEESANLLVEHLTKADGYIPWGLDNTNKVIPGNKVRIIRREQICTPR